MKKRYAFAISLSLTLALSLIAATRAGASGDNVSAVTIGSTVADFKLTDTSGKEQKLSSLKGRNGTVLIFISTQCPVVRDYIERIGKLAADYRERGVNVIGINSNATETIDDMKAHASANNLAFPVLKDKGNKIADLLGAERTPEVFFLDASNKLVYHGRIDNHRNITLVNANDLRDAIDATLAGKPVVKAEASAFGCTIKKAS
ncbi:MAG TPA: thioredoxin family protein [Pyrinomonadaceae bacterium]|jgi:peroxiredoxin|nr:thioredoxin family protein [Pyrinomonadaceae bacterium]